MIQWRKGLWGLSTVFVVCSLLLISFTNLNLKAQNGGVTDVNLEITDPDGISSEAPSSPSSLSSSSSTQQSSTSSSTPPTNQSSSQESSSSSSTTSSTSSSSSSSSSVIPVIPGTQPLAFRVEPKNVFLGQDLRFVLGPAISSDNSILQGVPCEFWILSPKTTVYIVLKGITDSKGFCFFETRQNLASQNLDLLTNTQDSITKEVFNNLATPLNQSYEIGKPFVSNLSGGNPSLNSINNLQGGGNAFGIVAYQSILITSNADSYNVGGGVSDIGADYLGSDRGLDFRDGPNDSGGGGSESLFENIGNRNLNEVFFGKETRDLIFSSLARTGGVAAISLTTFVGVVIFFIYLNTRFQNKKFMELGSQIDPRMKEKN